MNSEIDNKKELSIKRASQTTNHYVFQFNDDYMFAYNFNTSQWKFFSDLLREWLIIEPRDPRFKDYIQSIIAYCDQLKELNKSPLYQIILRKR